MNDLSRSFRGSFRLGREVSADMAFLNWRRMVENGNAAEARKNGSIVMYDQAKYY
jgi:hypothetical protein